MRSSLTRIALAFVVVCSLSACGKDRAPEPQSPEVEVVETPVSGDDAEPMPPPKTAAPDAGR
ncbi:MAG: hypothetical protein IT373_24680 [Polyangiaceae bacterium]|nr:hypothetical protein [Polyangiaceae bacterium]